MKQYLDALQHILDTGDTRGDRTGTGTIGVFGYQMRFDLSEGFPAVTTKKLAWKAMVSELLWFLEGSSDERRLCEILHGTRDPSKKTIWTANADAQGVALGHPSCDSVKLLGNVYGAVWRKQPTKSGFVQIKVRSIEKGPSVVQDTLVPNVYWNTEKSDDFVGLNVVNNKGDHYTVIDKFTGGKNSRYLLQRLGDGLTLTVSRPNLRTGQFGISAAAGVGNLGTDTTGIPYRKRAYDTWYNMLSRCYIEDNPSYKNYGGRGIFVCDRWHTFSNFILDLERLPNFYDWLDGGLDLDKDYLCTNVYSPETCVFLPSDINKSLSNKEKDYTKLGVCITPEGSEIEFITHKELINKVTELPLSSEGIRKCLLGEQTTHAGCSFYYKEAAEGHLWRPRLQVDQINYLIENLVSDPFSRRHILTAWSVPELSKQALPPCHLMAQFFVSSDNKLSCHMYMRSCDAFLGLPFNIASYALLTHMLAQVSELSVGELVLSFGDLHIYKNHMNQVAEQLERDPMPLPTLVSTNPNNRDINSFTMDSFELVDYNPMPSIKAEMAV